MNEITKSPEGFIEKTRTNMQALIDRYVPRFTQEQVWEIERHHSDVVFNLLCTIHEYRERNEQMAKAMHGMQEEYYKKVALPVGLGAFKAEAEYDPRYMRTIAKLAWSPPPYRMYATMASGPIREEETPYLFEAVRYNFVERCKRELIPALEREFMKLYSRLV